MTYPRTVTVQLLDYDGTPVAGDPLENGFRVNWYDEEDGPGRGSCSLSLSESGSAELLPGRYINCLVEGTVRFTFKIQGNPEYKIIERGEEHDQIIEVSGEGWAVDLDEVITYPEYAQNFVVNTTWRLFSFASALFPNAGSWTSAVEYAEYLEGVTTAQCYGHQQLAPDGLWYPSPIGFPYPTNPYNLSGGVPTASYEESYWIRTDDQPVWDSTGYYFFRNEFTLSEFTAVTFTVTGDNFFTLFLEGVPILGENIDEGDSWMWQGWKEHQMFLPAGTYTVAAAIYNISFTDLGGGPINRPPCPAEGFAGGLSDNNPGGLLFVVYEAKEAEAPVHILSSDDTWDSHYEEEYWPGWTPGQIVQQLIDEAIARGGLSIYDSSTFGASTDSDGDDWRPLITGYDRPDIPTFAVPVGSTLLEALNKLVDSGFIHWHIQPGTQVLDIYRGREPTPVSAATLAGGVNLRAYERNATKPYSNSLFVQWEGGYETVTDAAAVTAYGTQSEGMYQTSAASPEEAILWGETEVARRAQAGYPSIVAVIEPSSAADCPYEAFGTGDYVTSPDGVVRVKSIACAQDDMGYAVWTSELNAKMRVPERERFELLKQIGGTNQVVAGSVR